MGRRRARAGPRIYRTNLRTARAAGHLAHVELLAVSALRARPLGAPQCRRDAASVECSGDFTTGLSRHGHLARKRRMPFRSAQPIPNPPSPVRTVPSSLFATARCAFVTSEEHPAQEPGEADRCREQSPHNRDSRGVPALAIVIVATKFLDVVVVLTLVRGIAGVDRAAHDVRSAIPAGNAFALENDQLRHRREIFVNRARARRRLPGDDLLLRLGFLVRRRFRRATHR